MSDLISRQAAISVVGFAMADSPSITRDDWNAIIEGLEGVPAVEPERKRGRWEEKKVSDSKAIEEWQSARCSVCGKYHTTPYMYYFSEYNYCPNCGADMKEEEDENQNYRDRS